jgi:hypothetical protein
VGPKRPGDLPAMLTEEQRFYILRRAVTDYVGEGWETRSVRAERAVLVKPNWLSWLLPSGGGGRKRLVLHVDEWGHVEKR